MKAITDKTKANRITKHIRQATHRSGFKYNVNDGYMLNGKWYKTLREAKAAP